ncbi:phosphotransferase-like protein [Streptomyces caeruleatus]|uniref:Chloramphenicol phosphotransferase n=1 Tax=Streptomyces caeruleatus TaxID=661399 RepID=A0A101TR32_9ACTN|nr:hypothetical protein AQJ67_32610 [Streptomyces caeruleatus]
MEQLDHIPARRGLVIFLNSTSSSGRSSIATELLRILDEPYVHLPVDAFHAIRSPTAVPPDQLPTVLPGTWQGFLNDRPTPTAFERLRAGSDPQSLQSRSAQSGALFRA